MKIIITSLSQRKVSVFLGIYVGLVLNSAGLIRKALSGGWLEILTGLLAAGALVAFTYGLFSCFTVFGKTLYKIAATFILVVSASASYYMTFFNVVIGYGVIVSTLTLDTDLANESFGYKFLIWIFITGILPGILLWRTTITADLYRHRWHGLRVLLREMRPALAALLVLVVGIKGVIYFTEEQAKKNNRYVASPGGILAHSYLPTNWIAGLAIYLHQICTEKTNAKTLFNPASHFNYQATEAMDDLFVVFVIGETTRWDHMGMLGYERDTTPLLAQEPNLVAMAGTSCDTATKLSLRCMFVREGGTEDNAQRTLKERNIFSVLRKLGFTSELFAMQSEAWFYSTLDVNTYEIREIIASAYVNSKKPIDDMLLVEQAEKSLAKHPQGKHLIILHTKGSHYLYSQRYTPEFARFTPECMDIDETCSEAQLFNSFDNSVLYVDYMMKNLFDKLRDKNAIVFYAADHGESIGDNNHFHATPKEMAPAEQFRVPIMVWASDKFLQKPRNQTAFAQLKALKDSGFQPNHTQIFDSMLGCMGYSSPDGGINEKNNWCAVKPE